MSVAPSELAYLIQEGQTDNPEIVEALVREYAPRLYAISCDLLTDAPDQAGRALSLTFTAFRAALSEPEDMQHYDSILNWLCAKLVQNAPVKALSFPLAGKKAARGDGLLLLLRSGHGLSVEQAAEITNQLPDRVHALLVRTRRRLAGLKRIKGREHRQAEIDQALDDLLAWDADDAGEHISGCPDCRDYLSALQNQQAQIACSLEENRPGNLAEDQVQAILALLADPDPEPLRRGRTLRLKELGWAGAAGIAVIVLFQLLNPLWTPEPAPPPTPTLPPIVEPAEQLREASYADLERSLLASPPPVWGEPISNIVETGETRPDWLISADGRYTARRKGLAIEVCTLAGFECFELAGDGTGLTPIALSSDGQLVSTEGNGTLLLWGLESRRLRYRLDGFSELVLAAAFAADNAALVTATSNEITLWNFDGNSLVRTATHTTFGVQALAVSADASRIAYIQQSVSVTVLDGDHLNPLLRFSTERSGLIGLSFSPDGDRLALTTGFRTVEVIGLSTPLGGSMVAASIFEFLHPGPVLTLDWAEEGQYLAASIENGLENVFLWDLDSGLPATLPFSIIGPGDGSSWLEAVRLATDGTLIAVQGYFVTTGSNQTPVGNAFAVKVFAPVGAATGPETSQFAVSKTDLLPFDKVLEDGLHPLFRDYPLSMEDAAARVILRTDLSDVIPADFSFSGAAYEPFIHIASFVYTTTIAPNRIETIVLRVRIHQPGDPLNLVDDLIGASAAVELEQIGSVVGERVVGGWILAEVDAAAPGVFRWSEDGPTRFRWSQNGYQYELILHSETATPDTRWLRLLQPIVLALVSANENAESFVYVVVEGDTCSQIAERFGTSVGRLTSDNGLDAACSIFAGQELLVPIPPAVDTFAIIDLDCDGSLERLRLIPDPLRPGTGVYFGLTVETIAFPGADLPPVYRTAWQFSGADVDVEFFDTPQLFQLPGECRYLIALTGFGGSGEDSGLRVLAWNGAGMDVLLQAGGFLQGSLPGVTSVSPMINTDRLLYDPSAGACYLESNSYAWDGRVFVWSGGSVTTGLDCFDGP